MDLQIQLARLIHKLSEIEPQFIPPTILPLASRGLVWTVHLCQVKVMVG